MKKTFVIIAILLIGGVVALTTGCEDDPKEACQQDMFCDGTVSVTACCTEGEDCYYTYNGNEYPDTDEGLTQLIEDLDCTTTKSTEHMEGDELSIRERLEWLLEDTRILSKQK
jgi:hypothetical protein